MKSVCPLLSCISVSRAISFFLPSAYLINQVTRFLKTKNEGSKGRKKTVVQVLGTCCKAHTSHITVLMVLAGSLHPLFYGRVPAYCHVLTLISPPSIFLLFFVASHVELWATLNNSWMLDMCIIAKSSVVVLLPFLCVLQHTVLAWDFSGWEKGSEVGKCPSTHGHGHEHTTCANVYNTNNNNNKSARMKWQNRKKLNTRNSDKKHM